MYIPEACIVESPVVTMRDTVCTVYLFGWLPKIMVQYPEMVYRIFRGATGTLNHGIPARY
jgi:hypothetical protein